MTDAAPHLPTALAGFLAAPVNPTCEEKLRAAMAAWGRARWEALWASWQVTLAQDAWRWAELALAADGDLRNDYASVLRTLIETLVAGRNRARRERQEYARKFRGSGPPANAWWLDFDD